MLGTSVRGRVAAHMSEYTTKMRTNPRWAMMFLFSRIQAARRIERMVTGCLPKAAASAVKSCLDTIDPNSAVKDLVQSGMHRPLVLPPVMIEEILEFSNTHLCYSRDNQADGFLPEDYLAVNKHRSTDLLSAYYYEQVADCPAISRLRDDPGLRIIADAYLGEEALATRVRLWWSFPAQRVTDADLHAASQDRFHFDVDGWRVLKFFFYLTPTDEDAGAHRCIVGSHHQRGLRHQFSLVSGHSTKELEKFYNPEQFVTLVGDAGFGFAEDPFSFHTGSVCRSRPRLMLELSFCGTSCYTGSKPPQFGEPRRI